MGFDMSKILTINLHLENDLGVFEPRDVVVGHVSIHAKEDTIIDNCVLWLYGLVKTRWKPRTNCGLIQGTLLPTGPRSTTRLFPPKSSDGTEHVCSGSMPLAQSVKDALRQEFSRALCHALLDSVCYAGTQVRETKLRSEMGELDWTADQKFKVTSSSLSECATISSQRGSANSANTNYQRRNDYSSICPKQRCPRGTLCFASDQHSVPCASQWKGITNTNESGKTYNGDIKIIHRSKIDLLARNNIGRRDADSGVDTSLNDVSCPNDGFVSKRKQIFPYPASQDGTGSLLDPSDSHELMELSIEPPEMLESTHLGLNTSQILARGTHVFHFEFTLPADLPSSFELPTAHLAGGAYARLYYGLRFEIQNQSAQIKHKQQREIIVFRPLELTHFPRLRDRITLHKEFPVSGCCGSPGGIILCDLTVNKTGFVPGESIIPQIHVVNRSVFAIQAVHLAFIQNVLLRGTDEQQHSEILRLFASCLKPLSVPELETQSYSVNQSTEDDPSLFSCSTSSSSYTQSGKSEGRRSVGANELTSSHSRCAKAGTVSIGTTRKTTSPSVAVKANDSSAYFEDIIHVPPLPATGLVGRQKLIYVEYILVLRLRLQGDPQGKYDRKMQIPITIGSDPTRETSFIGCTEVVPCYASFDYASGKVIEYDPSRLCSATTPHKHGHASPVYRYFKPQSSRPDTVAYLSMNEIRSEDSIQSANSSDFDNGSASSTADISASSATSYPAYLLGTAKIQTTSEKGAIETVTRANRFASPQASMACRKSNKTESVSSSESTSVLLLSNRRFFDDGSQVCVNGDSNKTLTNGQIMKVDSSLLKQLDYLSVRGEQTRHSQFFKQVEERDSSFMSTIPSHQCSSGCHSDHTGSDNEHIPSQPTQLGETIDDKSVDGVSDNSSETRAHFSANAALRILRDKHSGKSFGHPAIVQPLCRTGVSERLEDNTISDFSHVISSNLTASRSTQSLSGSDSTSSHHSSMCKERIPSVQTKRPRNVYWNHSRLSHVPLRASSVYGVWTQGYERLLQQYAKARLHIGLRSKGLHTEGHLSHNLSKFPEGQVHSSAKMVQILNTFPVNQHLSVSESNLVQQLCRPSVMRTAL